MSKTYLPKVQEIKRQWHQLDAAKFTLGRLATQIATLLRGKHKASFTPHMDVGDFVVVINADKVKLTGRKLDQEEYHSFSGYPGGLKRKPLKEVFETNPEQVVYEAVRKMLPAIRLRNAMLKRLKIVTGTEHNYKIDTKSN